MMERSDYIVTPQARRRAYQPSQNSSRKRPLETSSFADTLEGWTEARKTIPTMTFGLSDAKRNSKKLKRMDGDSLRRRLLKDQAMASLAADTSRKTSLVSNASQPSASQAKAASSSNMDQKEYQTSKGTETEPEFDLDISHLLAGVATSSAPPQAALESLLKSLTSVRKAFQDYPNGDCPVTVSSVAKTARRWESALWEAIQSIEAAETLRIIQIAEAIDHDEALLAKHKQELSERDAQHEAQVQKLLGQYNACHDKLVQQCNAQIKVVAEKCKNRLEREALLWDCEVKKGVKECHKQCQELKDKFKTESATARSNEEAKRKDLVKQHEVMLEELKKQHEAHVEEIEKGTIFEKYKNDHREDIAQLNDAHEAQISEMEKEYKVKIDRLKDEIEHLYGNEDHIRDMEEDHKYGIEEIHRAHQNYLDDLERTHQEEKRKWEEKMDDLASANAELRQEHIDASGANGQVGLTEKGDAQLTAQIDFLKNKIEKFCDLNAELRKQNQDLQQQLLELSRHRGYSPSPERGRSRHGFYSSRSPYDECDSRDIHGPRSRSDERGRDHSYNSHSRLYGYAERRSDSPRSPSHECGTRQSYSRSPRREDSYRANDRYDDHEPRRQPIEKPSKHLADQLPLATSPQPPRQPQTKPILKSSNQPTKPKEALKVQIKDAYDADDLITYPPSPIRETVLPDDDSDCQDYSGRSASPPAPVEERICHVRGRKFEISGEVFGRCDDRMSSFGVRRDGQSERDEGNQRYNCDYHGFERGSYVSGRCTDQGDARRYRADSNPESDLQNHRRERTQRNQLPAVYAQEHYDLNAPVDATREQDRQRSNSDASEIARRHNRDDQRSQGSAPNGGTTAQRMRAEIRSFYSNRDSPIRAPGADDRYRPAHRDIDACFDEDLVDRDDGDRRTSPPSKRKYDNNDCSVEEDARSPKRARKYADKYDDRYADMMSFGIDTMLERPDDASYRERTNHDDGYAGEGMFVTHKEDRAGVAKEYDDRFADMVSFGTGV